MPPKKKAKKTQTVSLDKRAQAKLLRGRASAFEAEATVEERIHELLEPAKVSANTYLLKVFHEKASAEKLSHKKKAYLDAGFAIKECKHEITSGEDAIKLKGVGKSSAKLINYRYEKWISKYKSFNDVVVVEPKNIRIIRHFWNICEEYCERLQQYGSYDRACVEETAKRYENATTVLAGLKMVIKGPGDFPDLAYPQYNSVLNCTQLYGDYSVDIMNFYSNKFFDTVVNEPLMEDSSDGECVKSIKSALASLPKDVKIGIDKDGVLKVGVGEKDNIRFQSFEDYKEDYEGDFDAEFKKEEEEEEEEKEEEEEEEE